MLVCAADDAAAEFVLDPAADPVLEAVVPVCVACWLSDLAAEGRLGTAPEVAPAASTGAARSAAAARANKGDGDNFIANVCICPAKVSLECCREYREALSSSRRSLPSNNRNLVNNGRMKLDGRSALT